MKSFTLYEPRDAPFAALNTRFDKASLPPGVWRWASNVRRDKGVVRARNGVAEVFGAAPGGIANGTVRGAASLSLAGQQHLLIAISDPASAGKVRIFARTMSNPWSELTVSGADPMDDKFGDTRLSANTEFVWFAAVPDPLERRTVVVIQNGIDQPRVWDPAATSPASARLAVHRQVQPPPRGAAEFSFSPFIDLQAGVHTYANTAGSVEFASVDAPPDRFVRLTVSTSAASGDSAEIQSIGLSCPPEVRQIAIVAKPSVADMMDRLRIQVRVGSTWHTLQDGIDPQYPRAAVPLGVEDAFIYAFDNPATTSPFFIDRLRVVWVSGAPSDTETLDIYAISGTGDQPGGSQYAISYASSSSRAESPGVVLPSRYTTRLAGIGGPVLGGAVIGEHPSLFYTVAIRHRVPSQAVAGEGVDSLYVYSMLPGESRFVWSGSSVFAVYSNGSWVAPSANFGLMASVPPGVPWIARRVLVQAPDGYHQPLPVGGPLAFANGRLFASGVRDSSTSMIWISQHGNPWRMREASTGDAESPTSISLAGEKVQAMVAASSSTFGSSSIHVYTDGKALVLAGASERLVSTPRVAGDAGTRSPRSAATLRGAVYVLDSDGVVQAFAGGAVRDISRLEMGDLLEGIPFDRRRFVSSAAGNGRLYVAFTPAGETANTRVAVFNTVDAQWESVDSLPTGVDAEVLLRHWDEAASRDRTLAVARDGRVFELEAPGQAGDLTAEAGVLVDFALPAIHVGMRASLTVGAVSFACDPALGRSLSVVRTYDGGGSGASSLDLSSAGTMVWREDGGISGSGVQWGPVAEVRVYGAVPAGWRLYGVEAQVSEVSVGRDS